MRGVLGWRDTCSRSSGASAGRVPCIITSSNHVQGPSSSRVCSGAGLSNPAATSRHRVTASASRSQGSPPSEPNHYELLGLDPDCEEDDIKAAFRRRAKELHPDLNREEGAEAAFVQLSRAYEVLSDPEARRQYDLLHSRRRINFFRDFEDDEDRGSGFRWERVGDRGRDRRASGPRPFNDDDSDEEEDEEDEDEEGPSGRPGSRPSPEELLENLARFMNGPGSLRSWQSGRNDPWGSGTSEQWHRAVERQMRGSPYGPGRRGYGAADDDEPGGGEWDPSRRPPGWTPPGRGNEWSHPRRQWDEEDQRGAGDRPGPGPGRRGGGGGGGGDFRRPFRI